MFQAFHLRTLTTVLLFLASAHAQAAVYYVDAVTGNDSATGTTAPWRTLSRVAATVLLPGDTVRLRCGQRWNETLRIGTSGTVTSPITVNAYPDGCTAPPSIDGSEKVPTDQWQLHSGNIYKVQFPFSLMRNGNLSERALNWRYNSSPGDSSAGYSENCLGEGFSCMVFTTSSGTSDSLLIAPEFAVSAGTNYELSARVKVPAGQPYFLYLRKNSAPWSVSGLAAVKRVGTGNWEVITTSFTAGESASNARIDIGVPGARRTVLVREIRVATATSADPVAQVFEGGDPITVAHHPNMGYDSSKPESVYFNTSVASTYFVDSTGRLASNYFVGAADEKLPAGAVLAAGNQVFIRTQNWSLGNYTVTGVSGKRVSFSPNSSHPLSFPGWGYFYTGALWMLDSPGEWFYDANNRTLYVWTSTGAAPGSTFSYSRLSQAADLFGRAYISIDGIAFRNASRGLDLSRSTGVQLTHSDIRNTAAEGVAGSASRNLSIRSTIFRNNLTDAVQASNSTDFSLTDSDIEDSGVVVNADGKVTSLPAPSYGAVAAGTKSVIRNNRIRNAAYIGIAVDSGSVVSDNAIETYCLVLNDCGGIYSFGGSGVLFENNYVSAGRGTRNGIPAALNTHTNGLYFDRGTNASTVRGNTVFGSDVGMQLIDARNNVIENNRFFGNKSKQLWLQQSARDFNATLGNVYGNVVRNNQFFPVSTGASVFQNGSNADPAVFATYSGNRYSTLLSPLIVTENSLFGSNSYQLADWQAAVGGNGARASDTTGAIAAPLTGRGLGRLGSNLVTNGRLLTDTAGWTRGGSPAPAVTYGSCPDGTSSCLSVTGAGTDGMLSSPRFQLTAGTWYRVTFDAAVKPSSQPINVMVRRAGPTSYDSLMGDALSYSGKHTFSRYTFTFKATATASFSSTDKGARLDFSGVTSGRQITVTNVEVVPISGVIGGESQFLLLSNTSRVNQQKSCPVTDSVVCASYLSFLDGLPVSWPVTLTPLQTMIIFAQDSRLPDTDGDGIPDAQDLCPGTSVGATANSAGCSREQ